MTIRCARTRHATERNAALRGDADTLKNLAEKETDVEIEWGHKGKPRGVTVQGSNAFTHPSGDSLTVFSRKFEHIDLWTGWVRAPGGSFALVLDAHAAPSHKDLRVVLLFGAWPQLKVRTESSSRHAVEGSSHSQTCNSSCQARFWRFCY